MNASEKPRQPGKSTISSEARIGTGITIAGIGFLGLMLALAEYLRAVPKVAMGWLAFGAILMILGGIIAASARTKAG